MNPRAWIVLGWLLLFAALFVALFAATQVSAATAPVACAVPAGVSCQAGGSTLLPGVAIAPGSALIGGIMFAVVAGVAFFCGLACFFWAAHLRTLVALRALAESTDDIGADVKKAYAVARVRAKLPPGEPG